MSKNIFEKYRLLAEHTEHIIVQRHQHGIDGVHSLNQSDGEAGSGIYAHIPSAAMRKYYTQDGENSVNIKLKRSDVIDLTHKTNESHLLSHAKMVIDKNAASMPGYVKPKINKSNVHRFGRIVSNFVETHHPWAKAYITHHKGDGVPTGKQVVIRDTSAIVDMKPA